MTAPDDGGGKRACLAWRFVHGVDLGGAHRGRGGVELAQPRGAGAEGGLPMSKFEPTEEQAADIEARQSEGCPDDWVPDFALLCGRDRARVFNAAAGCHYG